MITEEAKNGAENAGAYYRRCSFEELFTLKDILLKEVNAAASKIKVESYALLSDMVDAGADSNYGKDQAIIVKRMNLTFNEK